MNGFVDYDVNFVKYILVERQLNIIFDSLKRENVLNIYSCCY